MEIIVKITKGIFDLIEKMLDKVLELLLRSLAYLFKRAAEDVLSILKSIFGLLSKLFSIIYEKLHKIVSDFIQKRKKWSYLLSQVDYKSLKITRVVIKLLAHFLKFVLNNSVIKLRKVELSILRLFFMHT